MDQKTLKTLEFDRVIGFLGQMTASSLAKELVEDLEPSTKIDEIRKNIENTREAYQLLISRGNPPLFAIHSIRNEIKRVQMGGGLRPEGLLKIAGILRCARSLKDYIREAEEEDRDFDFGNIRSYVTDLASYKNLEDEIYRIIISEEEISDDASRALRTIRNNQKAKAASIKNRLNALVNSDKGKTHLQDSIYTMRDGRYVVMVKRESRSQIPGMVHDVSSSGQTLFVEPMAVVELNNQIRELEIEEAREIERILKELSEKVGEHSYEIGANEDILKELDFIFAKGKLAIKQDASQPILNDQGIINIKKGRHPLLKDDEVVPIDIYLGQDFDTLVITGPNTGGKTVSIKTLGLLTAMAQAGLFIPADNYSQIGVFDNIYADIGDEQSIEQSLSTFSSHMVNIVDIIERVGDNSLVLFDELGAGTDPTEGSVLAIAILEELRKKDIRCLATTHYNELKIYAMTTPGVENASMEFDVKSLRPTFRLLIGIPGRSNAFEISKRLGLPERIIDQAKNLVEIENVKFEDMLSEIEKNREIMEEEKAQAQAIRRDLEKIQARLEDQRQKTSNMREKVLEEAKEEAREIIRKAREESRLVLDELRDISKNMASDSSRRIQEATDLLRSSEKALDRDLQKDLLDQRFDNQREIKKGDSVKIPSLNSQGQVLSDPDSKGEVQVQVGIMRMNLPLDTLVLLENQGENLSKERAESFRLAKSKYISRTIDLRGKNVEDAMIELDKYLDDAYLSGLKEVEIIHGKGTGALREGLQPYLKKHRHIKNTRVGEYDEGGTGVTIAELR